MTSRCAEGFATGVVVGIAGSFLGGLTYFLVTRTILQAPEEAEPHDPAESSALKATPNPTFPKRD